MSTTGNTGIPKLINEKSKIINQRVQSPTINNPFDDTFSLSSKNEKKMYDKVIVDLNKIVDNIKIENEEISIEEKVEIAKIIDKFKRKYKQIKS